jgi:hypothetical protein
MAIFERPYESLEQLDETELEYHKLMFASGVPIAVPAAMYYCAKYGLNAPRWLIIEAVINRYRQDAIDYARWDAVIEVREKRDSLRKDIDELRALPGRKARNILNERSKVRDWAGTNNDDAFECASLLLADTPAHGKPDTIRRSYLKVEKNMRNPATSMRYRILETQFLRSVGADLALGASPDKKIVPLYDLTR